MRIGVKKCLSKYLELQLGHYDITKGFISDCLDLFETKEKLILLGVEDGK